MADNTSPEIKAHRKEIDAIDDQIIALLKERIAVVEKVGEVKRAENEKGLFIRSGREGSMVRRVYNAFRTSRFNASAAVAMWRQIIAASIHVECPLNLSMLYTRNDPDLLWLAREYFGTFIPITPVATSNRVVSELVNDTANVGVFPHPMEHGHFDDEDTAWWQTIENLGRGKLKIFAHLPAVITKESPKNLPRGLAVGNLTPEASGDDQSYFALELEETISTSRLNDLFTKVKLNAKFINTVSQNPVRYVLVQVEGFHDDKSKAIKQVTKELDCPRVIWLGAHPTPIEV